MGQYYNPIFLDRDGKPEQWFYSHQYNNGLKLMEHSWLDNDFVAVVESLIALDGPRRLVWAGDYADDTFYDQCDSIPSTFFDGPWVNTGWYGGDHPEIKPEGPVPIEVTTASHPYLFNVDKREYVDKNKVPEDRWGRIHPLPLLTCEGNGRGGGDYWGDWPHVGRWARDRVVSSRHAPPEDYTEIDVTALVEGQSR